MTDCVITLSPEASATKVLKLLRLNGPLLEVQ